MFALKNSQKLSDDNQIRLMLTGISGSGKSTAAATFPNPVFCNFDRTLKSVAAQENIQMLPFFDISFCRESYRSVIIHDAFMNFLKSDAKSLEPDQTLIIDSLTTLQEFFHRYHEATKEAQDNKYHIWTEKGKYLRDIHGSISQLRCHIVTILHEIPVKDEGEITDKMKIAVSGYYGMLISKNYTDSFRQCIRKGVDLATKKTVDMYSWQVKSSDRYEFVKSRKKSSQEFIPASYESLLEFYKQP